MPKKKEVEFLIAKYKADVAALEEREEDLLRRIQILENLVPTVLVWYMWKVSQANREVPFPQHETEEEAKEKLEHLENFLEDLQQADKLLKEEEKVMRERIKELEATLADQPEEYPEKMLDIKIPKPRETHDSETKDLEIEGLEEQTTKFEELLQGEDTDWKMVSEDLLKQVSELNNKLKNSSQKLKESEDYVKYLQDEYSNMEKELQAKIQLLEKRADRPTIPGVVDKKQAKSLQDELESKAALSALQEALAEVKSVRESLSRSPTPSKDGYAEPQVSGVEDFTPVPVEVPKTEIDLEPEETLPKSVVSSPEEVFTLGATEKTSKISIPKPEIFEPEVALATDTTEPATGPEVLPLVLLPESESVKSPQSLVAPQDSIAPPDITISIEAISEPAETKISVSETPVTPDIPQGPEELVAPAEDMVVPTEELVSKEPIFEPGEAEKSVLEKSITPEIPQAPAEPTATVDDMVVSPETAPEQTEEEIPSPQTSIQPVEGIVVSPDKIESKEIFDPAEEETRLETEVLPAPAEPETIVEEIVAPLEKQISEEPISEPSEPGKPLLEPQLTLETPQPSAEPATGVADISSLPVVTLSKEAISEQPEVGKRESEPLASPDIIQEPVAPPETVVAPPETIVKDAVSESDEAQTHIPEVPIDSGEPQVPTDTTPGPEGIAPSDTKMSKDTIPQTSEDQVPVPEPLASPDIEATISKETIYKPDVEMPEPEMPVSTEFPPTPAEPLVIAEDVVAPLEKTASKETIPEPTEAQMVKAETPATSGVPEEVVSSEEGILIPPETKVSGEPGEIEMPEASISPQDMPLSGEPEIPIEGLTTLDEPSDASGVLAIPTDEAISEEPLLLPKEELLETETPKEPSVVAPTTDIPPITDRPADAEPITISSEIEHLQEPLTMEHAEVEPLTSQEVITPPAEETVVEEGKFSEEISVPTQMVAEPTIEAESVILKTADETEAQVMVSEPMEISSPELDSRHAPPGVGLKQDADLPAKTPTVSSLAAQTLQGKQRVKDHLIKSLADELRDLARNNVWTDMKPLENAVKSSPVKTYDFDRNILHLYLKGEEPKNYVASMKGQEDVRSNPLHVRIAQKLDKDSLLIEWEPPSSAEVAGFQIFLNGQFMYWVHSAKRNVALLHPLDLRLILEIAVSPINVKGDIIFRSIVVYKPE